MNRTFKPNWKKTPWRSPAYLAHVREQPCAVPECRLSAQIEAHHVYAGGMGTKCGDHEAIPLCGPFGHHAILHQIGKATFEHQYGVDLEAEIQRTQEEWVRRGNKREWECE